MSASLSNRETGEQYSIPPSTVKTHLESIYRKYGVSSRTQAVEQALLLNLVWLGLIWVADSHRACSC